ncbi:CAP domain-containing protein [Acaryochloris sp. IP29b_bin.137]|uniref:CAP domain-containing protein n=1 Tax=Acaryochloris sp. IP29b_bin.137 TaxID=2969217 RepID=UPI002607CFB2|nr:CAP domain-containing protein [Acaryochloris sp. IP29b_bin.137]
MAKSSLSRVSLTVLEQDEVGNKGQRTQLGTHKSLSWLLVGCIALPIKLPFPVPFECKTPRQTPTIRRQPRQRKSVPQPTPEPVLESPKPIPPQESRRDSTAVAQGNLSQLIYTEVNDIRQSYGLQPLQWNANVANVARRHSQNMADNNFFSHADRQGNTALERLLNAGIRFNLVAENLALNENAPDPVALAIEGWLDSPGHRQNMLRAEVTDTGVGVVRQGEEYFFTQVFIRQP